jgi:CBS domain-containing protein
MKIKDIMTPDVDCVWPDDTIQESARKMRVLDVGSLPVCEGERLGGIITDRDIAVRSAASGLDPKTGRVREVMTQAVIYVHEDDDTADAARLMQERQVRRILVLDRAGRLAGIVSVCDLAAGRRDPHRLGQVLMDVSEPAVPRR